MLQVIAFCIVCMGFVPRLASEDGDNAAVRLARIEEIIGTSKFGIHDLSRCIAVNAGDFARMNMPFELGIDYGCRQFGSAAQRQKSVLVLEQAQRDYRVALSDIAGWDIEYHGGDQTKAVRRVRNWLLGKPGSLGIGAAAIQAKHSTFQGWYLNQQLALGASVEDVADYPSHQIIPDMVRWIELGEPTT